MTSTATYSDRYERGRATLLSMGNDPDGIQGYRALDPVEVGDVEGREPAPGEGARHQPRGEAEGLLGIGPGWERGEALDAPATQVRGGQPGEQGPKPTVFEWFQSGPRHRLPDRPARRRRPGLV